jgi:DNA-binding LacI/PurR family transcriptional regulator
VRRTTIRDIAEKLSLSTATVSKVLNARQDGMISEATRQRVHDAARELGYSPNFAARALVMGRTNTIAVWAQTLADFHASVVNQMQDVLRPSGFEMVITDVVKHPDLRSHFQRMPMWPVDGSIALDAPNAVSSFLDAAPGYRTPLVSMGAYHCDKTDSVAVDLYSGVAEGVRQLVASGRRRIAYLVCDFGNHRCDARYDAYTDVLREAGVQPEYLLIHDSSRSDGRRAILEHLQRGRAPEALVCFNDEMALGAYRGLSESGLSVPDDVALMGCDGIQDTEYLPCPLSTVVQPIEAMCRAAWDFLQARMEDPMRPRQQVLLQACFSGRQSTVRTEVGAAS